MTRDVDESIGDQPTLQGGKPAESMDRSLGDRRTHIGDSSSSIADLSDVGSDVDQVMEKVDLSARYTIEGVLGKGGMGEVLLATDTRLDRKVAVKRILGEAARSKTAVSRFLTEAKSIAALNHPNVVQIYDYGRAKDGPFLIMEYVDGSSLLDRCRDGAIPIEDAVHLACQLCDGLGRAHDLGIIHRDIKPANVLLTQDGVPKLTDFGLAKAEAADTGMTMAGAVLGTLDFMPPEQRRDAALTDARSDLWSLAATLYQMVTGEPPRVIDLDAVPQQIRAILSQALKTKKEDRYQSARELKEALKRSLQKTTFIPVISANMDLGTGECPACHVANESHRKFCRECSGPLRCKCLKCEHEIPVWDKVCPECGANQPELVNARLKELRDQRKKAETLRSSLQYSDALKAAQFVANVTDPRISENTGWAEGFIKSVECERNKQQESRKKLFEEAVRYRNAFSYPEAIAALERIPAPLRTSEVTEYLRAVNADFNKSNDLYRRIAENIRQRMTAKLKPDLDQYKELRGTPPELQILLDELKCPQCQKVNNPNRKNCIACNYKLTVSCLRCDRTMPIWDSACEGCGANQTKVLDELYRNIIDNLQKRMTVQLQLDLDRYQKSRGIPAELQVLLDELKCPKCQQINKPGVQNCTACGCSLSVACLQCGKAMPIWDSACTACGAKQKELVDSANEEIRRKRRDAESLLKELEFDQAMKIANQISCEPDPRLLQSRQWFADFTQAIERTNQKHTADVVNLVSQALDREKAHDYTAAIALLEQVPSRYATMFLSDYSTTAAQLLDRLSNTLAECVRLQQVIKSRVDARQLNGLLTEVNNFLKFRPNDVGVSKLQTQLIERDTELRKVRDKAFTRARKKFNDFDYTGTLSALLVIDDGYLDEEVLQLKEKATSNQNRLKELRDTIAARVKAKDLYGLLPEVTECIELQPTADDLLKLRDQLVLREHKNAEAIAELVEKSRLARTQCKFDVVTSYLHRIPPELLTEEIAQLTTECQKLSSFRTKAMQALGRAMKTERYSRGVRQSRRYRTALKQACLEDGSFNTAFQACEIRAKEARRNLISLLKIALATATAVSVAGLGVFLYQRNHPQSNLSAVDASRIDVAVEKPIAVQSAVQEDKSERILSRAPAVVASISLELKLLPAGKFVMGEGSEAHEVILTKPFFIGVYEVTQAQYERVMGVNPSKFKGAQNPVEQVSWEEAVEFCRKLSELPEEKAAGRVYRLPTEAEWEYACRAGTTSKFSFGDDETQFGEHGWQYGNSSSKTHSVGQKKSNPWGLYDMHGNVWEWCSDWYGAYPNGAVSDPVGPSSGSYRVKRGGSWGYEAALCESADRGGYAPDDRSSNGSGFRVALSSPEIPK